MNVTIKRLYQKIDNIKYQYNSPTRIILGENQYNDLIRDKDFAVSYLLSSSQMTPMFLGLPVTMSYKRKNYLCVLSNKPKYLRAPKNKAKLIENIRPYRFSYDYENFYGR
jgi:hypothetical protein